MTPELIDLFGRKVQIRAIDGQLFRGTVTGYTSAADNEPDPESITIGSTELFAEEIQDVELLDN